MPTPFWHTLYFKSAAGLALILLIAGLCYSIFASFMAQKINQSGYQQINHDLALNLVRDNKIVHDGNIDQQAMKDTFMQYMNINPSIEIYYLDLHGQILAYSAEPGKVKREAVDLQPLLNQLNNPHRLTIMGDDPRSADTRKFFSVTPIPDASNAQGYLYVMLQSEELTQALNQQSQKTIIYLGGIVLAGSLGIGLLIGLYLFYRINRRLKSLQNKVARFVQQGFSSAASDSFSPQPLMLQDEISELEKHIAGMANHIQQQWSALKQQDSLRREMVANISHDLRTPLASIQGYLETLSIKYTQLSDTDKQHYIQTAVRQANGLQNLIDSLFDLARLDAQEQQLQLETFPLLELVYDVIAKFELKAQHKSITLNIQSETENPLVTADLGLIERVLDNLISNAIYYSHRHSTISIHIAAPQNGSLTILVSDTGRGIAEDQKPLVFERFHQAHSPERQDGHAGLGLCIVKKIIDLHQQRVWVESELNQGARFNFTLACE